MTMKAMKPRLRACLSALLTGEHGVVSRSAMPRAVSYLRTLVNSQSEGIQSLRWSFHSSADEDDDFSELGVPVAQGVGTHLKLKTEKPDPFWKNEPGRRSSSGMSLPAEGRPRSKDVSSKLANSSPAPTLKPDNQVNISSTPTIINASNFKSSSSVSVENVPSTISLSQLKKELSVFGEISKASMTSEPNEFDCCYVQFESVESRKKAISIGEITVRNFILPIRPLCPRKTVTIRISNIGSETADSAIHSVCMSFGSLAGLVRTKEGLVDALFSVKDNSKAQKILKKLNHTSMDDCKWTACLHSRDFSPEVTTNKDYTQCNLGLQIISHLDDLETELSMKKVYAEDLKILHHALMHLEAHPASRERSS
ncbi:uncharacterized protein LOC133851319 isoform X2 [Alnus glutinosa]|uniref:uncharacterized protein LOC133851319 isoform X2 n=1 Tax=Alnus glutinosa TaxID=3517 RepID=UPI002D78BFD9|nr:uncharacterized protein LOC133851319 isoform X2 [Alnus glutinosa]